MTTTAVFMLEVELPDTEDDDRSVREAEREARELLYSAPAFDGFGEDAIACLDFAHIRHDPPRKP